MNLRTIIKTCYNELKKLSLIRYDINITNIININICDLALTKQITIQFYLMTFV